MIDNRVESIFQDAESLYHEAIDKFDRGNIRDAAEKAWGATLRATNALILAKTGDEPKKTPLSSRKLEELALQDGEVEELKLPDRYHTRSDYLHGDCFYLGICEPKDRIERRIRETKHYIQDARKLAGRA